jgi:HEAT repeat protein
VNEDVRDLPRAEVVKSRRNAVECLCRALLSHPDEERRHFCAELLREAGDTAAVPALIIALRDKSPHVRFDVLSALCKILKVDLGWWLNIEAYDSTPGRMHRRAAEWWKRNRHYVWW